MLLDQYEQEECRLIATEGEASANDRMEIVSVYDKQNGRKYL
jgi:hypothetical protein